MLRHERDIPRVGDETPQVLRFVATGLGAGAIAARLGCDREDIRRHLADAIQALDARFVPDAIEIAIRRGLIHPPR